MADANPPPGRPAQPRELESTFDLIDRVRQGDAQALDRLLAQHLKPLQRWASGRLPVWARDLADTDDLVQETLTRTLRKIGSFEPRHVGAFQRICARRC